MDAKIKWPRRQGLFCSLLLLAALASLMGCSGAIDEVAPAEAQLPAENESPAAAGPTSAAETTEAFFAWYLGYIGDGETRRNPLVDGAYRDSELLSPAFVEHVDETLAQMEGGGFDPFLLAQDIPETVTVAESVEEDDSATVTVNRTYSGNPEAYPMEVRLQRHGDGWQITDIVNPQAGKATSSLEAVAGFYGWYLSYIGDPATDTFRNPLVDRAYRGAPYISEAFVAEIDAVLDQQIEESGGFMADPILQAQDIPSAFEVEMGPAEDIVTVNLYFGETVHPVQVRVVNQGDAWLVDSILPPG